MRVRFDPMATGLLVCLVNSATRLASYAEAGRKTYAGTIDLGRTTTTDDIQGEELSRAALLPPYSAVRAAAARYMGRISQTPPNVSAVKVHGVRAYKLARQAQSSGSGDFNLQPRWVEIYRFDLEQVSERRIFFRIECSKGTYIRAIARDLGRDLGCGAVLSSLRRESSSPFGVNAAKSPEEIGWENLVSWQALFPGVPCLRVGIRQAADLRCGNQAALGRLNEDLRSDQWPGGRAIYVDDQTGQPFGLLVRSENRWQLAVNVS
jgi:tRNA pseudouridine55 synthase